MKKNKAHIYHVNHETGMGYPQITIEAAIVGALATLFISLYSFLYLVTHS